MISPSFNLTPRLPDKASLSAGQYFPDTSYFKEVRIVLQNHFSQQRSGLPAVSCEKLSKKQLFMCVATSLDGARGALTLRSVAAMSAVHWLMYTNAHQSTAATPVALPEQNSTPQPNVRVASTSSPHRGAHFGSRIPWTRSIFFRPLPAKFFHHKKIHLES